MFSYVNRCHLTGDLHPADPSSVDGVCPVRASRRLHWFGLSVGWYWPEVGGHQLLRRDCPTLIVWRSEQCRTTQAAHMLIGQPQRHQPGAANQEQQGEPARCRSPR
ncbi:DUF5984 family protein [Dactylosporangium sp. CA-152071]|uniref:DUF5984 family protein n=1 Tax=Dactylosporangium sp. CA-152071 TaxID=3239933 RepID=UPI003D920ABA